MSARSHRRWFQFSVRGLLLLTTTVAIGLGLWGSKFHRRHQALKQLRVFMPRAWVQYVEYEEPPSARWLRRQKWLTKLVGDDWFDEPVEIKALHRAPLIPRTPTPPPKVNDADVRPLEYLDTLKRLSLKGTGVGDEGMPYLRGLPNLECLNIGWSHAGDAALENMMLLTKLEQLNLPGTGVTDAGLRYLSRLKSLQSCDLTRTHVDGSGFRYLSSLTSLKHLELPHTDLCDSGLRHLSKLKALQHLDLNHTRVSDEGIAALKDLRELVWLDLSQTDIRGNTLDELRACPIEHLLLLDTRLSEQALTALRHFLRLERLLLSGSTVTGRGFAEVETLPALTELDLSRTTLTDEGLLALPSAPRLRRLLLNETAITDEGLKYLGNFEALETLELRGAKITGKALAYLQRLPRLSYLDLSDTQIEDADIDALNEICSLAAVSLLGTRVTETALTELQMVGSIANEPVDSRTMAGLCEPTELDFRQQPLSEVLDYLKARHEVEIQLEPRLWNHKDFGKCAVTCSRNGLALMQALHELLAPHRCGLVYRHGVLQIMLLPTMPALRVPILKDGEVLSPLLATALAQKTELDFANEQLGRVVDWLAQQHRIDIHFDDDDFRDPSRLEEMRINRSIKGVTLRAALGLLLEPLDLVCVAEGESLIIRPGNSVQAKSAIARPPEGAPDAGRHGCE